MMLYVGIFGLIAAVLVSCWVLLHEADANALEGDALKEDELKAERKRQAKRANERLKLAATFVSNFGVVFFVGFLVTPLSKGEVISKPAQLGILAFLIISHGMAHFILHLWRSED